jgi:hypothetical protein
MPDQCRGGDPIEPVDPGTLPPRAHSSQTGETPEEPLKEAESAALPLERRKRHELYALARKRRIKGRSAMRRKDLIRALQGAPSAERFLPNRM